jgi:hypothetical protein
MAEGQEDRERRCGGGGLTGGLCLRVVDGEPHLFQPPGRREPAEISSGEAGPAGGWLVGQPLYSVRSAVIVRVRAAQLAGSSAPSAAMARADSPSRASSAGL